MKACGGGGGGIPHQNLSYDGTSDSNNTSTTTTTTTTSNNNTGSTTNNNNNNNSTTIIPSTSQARTTTPPPSSSSPHTSSIATLQHVGNAHDAGNNSNNNINNNNDNNNENNVNNKKSTKSRTTNNANAIYRNSEDIPDHVLFIKFKQGEERIYSDYFRREQRHLLLVVVVMTMTHAVTSVVLDTVPESSWNLDRLYRVIVVLSLTTLVLILYGVQRLDGLSGNVKECAAILVWFLLSCQMFYACTTTVPRHVASDDLSWIALLTFATQVTLPVGAWRAAIACLLLVACHSTMVALRNGGDSELVLQILANGLVVVPSVLVGVSVSVFMDRLLRKSVLETKAVLSAKAKIEAAYQEKKSLLLSVLPSHVAEEMIQDVGELSDGQFRKIYMSRYEDVSILFADIVGFTAISSSVTAAELVQILNQLFGRFDVLANRYHQDRIKILGDCYYCVCGALSPRPDHAVLCIHMGLAMVDTISFVRHKTGKDVNMRVGVHTGACLGGVLGQRQWQFDVLGKEVTLANKMESGGIPARVHISETTKACLNEEFELEDGHGGDREEDLRLKNVTTYLVKAVIKPYPQGTLDDVADTPTDNNPSTDTPPTPTTTTTATTTSSTNPPPASNTTISTYYTNPTISTTSITSDTTPEPPPPPTTTTTTTTTNISSAPSSSSSTTSAPIPNTTSTTTTTTKPMKIAPPSSSSSLQTTTTDISATTKTTHNIKQQHQRFQTEHENSNNPTPNSNLPQKRSQSVKTTTTTSSTPRNKNRVHKVCVVSHSEGGKIQRNSKTRKTIATTNGRRLKDQFYNDDNDDNDIDNTDGEGVMGLGDNLCCLRDGDDDDGGGGGDGCKIHQGLRMRISGGGSSYRPTAVEMDLKRALEEKEANRTLGGRINRLTLTFTDVSMETRYKHRSQSYSGLPLVALCMAFFCVAGARFVVLPRSALAIFSYLFGQLVLTVMAVISMSATWTKRFPGALVRFSVTVEYHKMARMLWGASACAVFFLCDVIPITECATTPHNTSSITSAATNRFEPDTQDPVCRYAVYYAYSTTLTLFAVTSLVNVGHVTKVLAMKTVMGVQCILYLVVADVTLDNYDVVVYAGHTDFVSTKHRLVAQALAITFILSVYDRKMERLYRKLFLWKEESKREKGRAMGLQRKNEALVFNLMPAHVAKDFIGTRVNQRGLYSKAYDETGVIFAACPNFHAFYNESAVNNNGLECLRFLNEIISDYDELLNQVRFSSIVKIKTVGPTYMAVSGMTESGVKPSDVTDRWSHLNDLVQFAFGLQDVLRKINEQSFNNFILRIGINHGPLIAGVIGVTKPHYDVWGNTVNVASRMESTGQAGRIQVVEETKKILERFGYRFESRGLINVKGKGQLVTYFLERATSDLGTTGVMPNQVPDTW